MCNVDVTVLSVDWMINSTSKYFNIIHLLFIFLSILSDKKINYFIHMMMKHKVL